ncbi:hypothetical protein QOZ80_2AG0121420 [Eleusine coracana subsp. coracana]|nr:hypothetical protein QOZ80_2AG0121420 [Eleusine coracana subsp. coracana]
MPVIGHLHLVSSRPHVSLRDLAARHGDEGLMLLRLGTVRTLVASSPRAAQAVLRTHDQSFASRPRSVVGDVLSWGPSDVGFAPYGERWRQSKKLVTTHLLSSKKVQSYRAAREEEVSAVISKIGRAAAAHTAVDMSELLSSFTSDVVCRAVAGRSYRAEGWNKVFPELIGAAMVLMGGFNLENFYPGPANVAGGVLTWPVRWRAERLRHRWDTIFDALIDERARELARDGCCSHTEQLEADFVTALLLVQEEYGLTRDGIKGILADMFTPGTETSYLVLEFAMAELMLHQETMVKLQADVRRNTPRGQETVAEENFTGMMSYSYGTSSPRLT